MPDNYSIKRLGLFEGNLQNINTVCYIYVGAMQKSKVLNMFQLKCNNTNRSSLVSAGTVTGGDRQVSLQSETTPM